ncbi:unnamed protein product [Cunninghamella echinulata]
MFLHERFKNFNIVSNTFRYNFSSSTESQNQSIPSSSVQPSTSLLSVTQTVRSTSYSYTSISSSTTPNNILHNCLSHSNGLITSTYHERQRFAKIINATIEEVEEY